MSFNYTIPNITINASDLAFMEKCFCECGILSDVFKISAFNLFFVVMIILLLNKVYSPKSLIRDFENMTKEEKILRSVDLIAIAMFFMNLAGVFFYLFG
jgi:hypothetical protein